MKTLKVSNGDIDIDAKGEFKMIEADEEIAQGAEMCMKIRLGEFELDEYIGMRREFLGDKNASDEDVGDAVLDALQSMTDQEILDGADDITINRKGRQAIIGLHLIKSDGENISLEGVDIDGS